MPDNSGVGSGSSIHKFQIDISEIATLIKISDEIGADISEGRRLLLIAINMGKSSKNFDIIAKYLGESRSLMERAIEEVIVEKLKSIQSQLETRKDSIPPELGTMQKFQATLEYFKIKDYKVVAQSIRSINEDIQIFTTGKATAAKNAAEEKLTEHQAHITPSEQNIPPFPLPPPPQMHQQTTPPVSTPSVVPLPSSQAIPTSKPSPTPPQAAPLPPPPQSQSSPAQSRPPQSPPPHTSSLQLQAPAIKSSPALAPAPQSFSQTSSMEHAASQEKPKPDIRLETASEPKKCSSCMGKIKQGLPVLVCRCGQTYHEPCAKRAGRCVMCGAVFN